MSKEKPKPIKRNPNLYSLSHDHHHGLVFCLRLSKGVKQTDSLTLKAYVKYFWENELDVHFRQEEEVLMQGVDPSSELVQHFWQDHQEIREMFQQIASETTPDNTLYIQFSAKIKEHIRFEERQLFPYLESILSDERLIEIKAKLDETPSSCPAFYPEFWKA